MEYGVGRCFVYVAFIRSCWVERRVKRFENVELGDDWFLNQAV